MNNLTPTKSLNPFGKFCCTIGNLPTSYMISLTYEEQLLWFCNFLQNNVIPAVNNNAECLTELQNYVANYFSNLNVQDEINNKLDEMAQDGTLQNLIEQFLQLNSLLCFNNVQDLKNSPSLISGSFAKTLGYYEINDGGEATYFITSTLNENETENDLNIIKLNNGLYAHLVYNTILNVKQFGMYCNNINDDGDLLQNIINFSKEGDIISFPNSLIKIGKEIEITKPIILKGTSNTSKGTTFYFNNTSGLSLKANYIIIENINIIDSNRPDYSTLNITNNNFGNVGVRFEYNDNYSNGGCKLINCFINNFNVGIAIYNTITTSNQWSGAYRVFENCIITYNDVGILLKNGATFNKVQGGNISENEHNGIYSNAENSYNILELNGTALENNGINTNFTNEIFSDFGIYNIGNSKLNFVNCYLELMKCFVESGATFNLINSHIHSNVYMSGNGQILSDGSFAPYKTIITNAIDLVTRMNNTNCPITQPVENISQINATCNQNGVNMVTLPNIINLPIPIKNIEMLQVDFDVRINSTNSNFAVKPIFQIVGNSSTGTDNTNVSTNYPVKNLKYEKDKWIHQTFCYRPRVSSSYLTDGEKTPYRISPQLIFSNSETSNSSDYTTENLNVDIANMNVTVHSKSAEATNVELGYLKTLIASE